MPQTYFLNIFAVSQMPQEEMLREQLDKNSEDTRETALPELKICLSSKM